MPLGRTIRAVIRPRRADQRLITEDEVARVFNVAAVPDVVIQDEVHFWIAEQPRILGRLLAETRERHARRLILERFPRTGPWFIDHPRALALLFRVRPSLRPTLPLVVSGTTVSQEADG
jgi:hypothetical protein